MNEWYSWSLCWHWNRFEICRTYNISFSLLIDLISILWFQAWSLDLAHSQWTVWNVCGLIVYPWKRHYFNIISLLLLFFIQRVISNLHTIIDYFPNPIANWQGQKRIPKNLIWTTQEYIIRRRRRAKLIQLDIFSLLILPSIYKCYAVVLIRILFRKQRPYSLLCWLEILGIWSHADYRHVSEADIVPSTMSWYPQKNSFKVARSS